MHWIRTNIFLLTLISLVVSKNVVDLKSPTNELNVTQTHLSSIPPFESNNNTLTEHECHDIHTIPKDEQCQFIEVYCEDYKIGLINYVSLYYCYGGKVFKIISYIFALMILFTTLGITASEFLCPNLDTISKFFRMSESLAGVTLLALGNGSPDVFSTLEAMKVGSANLAIGELCGAALYITCVVVGSMAIVRPFKVAKKPFIRDVLFLIFALIITIVFLSDEKITIWESIVMLLLYVIYVLFVVSWDWITTKKRRNELIDQRIRNQHIHDPNTMTQYQVDENQETNDDDILGNDTRPGIEALVEDLDTETLNNFEDWTKNSQNLIRPSILGAIEFNAKMQEYYENREGAIQLKDDDGEDDLNILLNTFPNNHVQPLSSRLRSEPAWRDEENITSNHHDSLVSTAPAYYNLESFYENPAAGMEFLNSGHADYSDVHNVIKEKVKQFFKKAKLLDEHSSFLYILFPTLKGFTEKSSFDKFFSIVCLPLVALLRLTVPVVDEGFDIMGKGYVLLVLQCMLSPYLIGSISFGEGGIGFKILFFPLIVSVILLGVLYGAKASNQNELVSNTFRIFCALAGFGTSIFWISTIAAELISVIKFFSLLLNLSDAILGVTVFAVGNSLGDFISNFTIARMGFPMMALSACFGGPLLNILLGIGGSGLIVIPMTGPLELDLSHTLIVSGIALLVNLVFLLIAVPLNRFEMNKVTGWFMVGLWTAATIVCVILELFPW